MRRAAALGIALVAIGCSATARMTTDVGDYTRYRSIRTATTREQRLRAAFRYIETEPSGRFRDEVRAWFVGAENDYYEHAGDNLGRLRLYLDTLPRGPHAAEVRTRIAEIEATQRIRRQHEHEVVGDALAVEQNLADAEKMRKELVLQVTQWVGQLAAIRSFGERTSELSGAFLHDFREVKPFARCVRERCAKTVSLVYEIPEPGRLSSREAIFDVAVLLKNGNVSAAMLTGPELFSRIGEALELRPASETDPGARAEAMGRAADLVRAAAEPAMPAARCAHEAVAPVVVSRQCDGVRLSMIAATGSGEEDRVVVEPAPSIGE